MCIHRRFCYPRLTVSEIARPLNAFPRISSSSPAEHTIVQALQKKLEQTEQRLQYAELRVQLLEEKLRQKRIEKYGPHSEKLSTLQLELLEEEPGVSEEEVKGGEPTGTVSSTASASPPSRPADAAAGSAEGGKKQLPARRSSACVPSAAGRRR